MSGLSELPNIGKVLERNLLDVGIKTPAELRALGSREAFLRIRTSVDPGACLHMLQGLEGAVRGIRDSQLPPDEREALRQFFRSLDEADGGESVVVRAEAPGDIPAIREIHVAAFRDLAVSRQTEHLIVDALRDAGALAVSLVAEVGGVTAGHIAFSEAIVGDAERGWFLLGPIGVLPARQGCGVGSALVRDGVDALRAQGALGCVLVGEPGYYGRFGFTRHEGLGYEGVPDHYVLALPLSDVAPRGLIHAHPAFDVEPE